MRAKQMAFRKNKPLNEIIEAALEQYLKSEDRVSGRSVVKATRSAIPASHRLVKRIIEEEPFLDS